MSHKAKRARIEQAVCVRLALELGRFIYRLRRVDLPFHCNPVPAMTELLNDAATIDVTDLLTRYSFDLTGYRLDYMVAAWLQRYPANWLRMAVVEALYQGRYKAISVEQILKLWQRRGKPLPHFNREFERIICNKFSKSALLMSYSVRDYPASPQRARVPSVPASPPVSVPVNPPLTFPSREPSLAEPVDDAASASERSLEMTEADLASTAEGPSQDALPLDDFADTGVADTIAADPGAADPDAANDVVELTPVSIAQSSAKALELIYSANSARAAIAKDPIHQFVPTPIPSGFCERLRAVAQNSVGLLEPDTPGDRAFQAKLKTVTESGLPVKITALGPFSAPEDPADDFLGDRPDSN